MAPLNCKLSRVDRDVAHLFLRGERAMEQWLIAAALLLVYLGGLYVAGRD
jgi:hypothetical protein